MHSSTPMRFRKSSYSGSGDNCVELADLPNGAAIRDTQNRELGHIELPAREMAGLLGAIRNSQL
ncbi:DUF397 domain-containing protein [Nocardiopsis ansamitocini]|uniref:DUF397 domain-containing protein n=1 Tax=Nocardiopsis ansamitocini TaxID=1670832 RepID=A0A9W6P8P4_9ACTN|nr:DUF397 domain-containing protein [Nocardiopsis ansamitocini]GLU49042.1 hypothetical protein Nans01_33930 [Nocardiopsis ansamitocini]